MIDIPKVVALIELGAARHDVGRRAALLATQLDAQLVLLHVLPARMHRRKAEDLESAAVRTKLAALGEKLAREYGGVVTWDVVRGDPVSAVLAHSSGALLLAVASRRRNTLKESIFGTPTERLIRMARIPVLVVKRPAGSAVYRKVLVPVDFSQGAKAALALALQFSKNARTDVLHVLSIGHGLGAQTAEAPEQARRASRKWAGERTDAALRSLIREAGGDAHATPTVGFGEPASVILQKAAGSGTELIAVAKHHPRLLARFLLGTLTQSLLAHGEADVLILPIPARVKQHSGEPRTHHQPEAPGAMQLQASRPEGEGASPAQREL